LACLGHCGPGRPSKSDHDELLRRLKAAVLNLKLKLSGVELPAVAAIIEEDIDFFKNLITAVTVKPYSNHPVKTYSLYVSSLFVWTADRISEKRLSLGFELLLISSISAELHGDQLMALRLAAELPCLFTSALRRQSGALPLKDLYHWILRSNYLLAEIVRNLPLIEQVDDGSCEDLAAAHRALSDLLKKTLRELQQST
jgi:hypothetical protein